MLFENNEEVVFKLFFDCVILESKLCAFVLVLARGMKSLFFSHLAPDFLSPTLLGLLLFLLLLQFLGLCWIFLLLRFLLSSLLLGLLLLP